LNLKLFVELLWDFLSSACFHSRISTFPRGFLLVFGNKRGFFAKKVPFSRLNQQIQASGSVSASERFRLNQPVNKRESEPRLPCAKKEPEC